MNVKITKARAVKSRVLTIDMKKPGNSGRKIKLFTSFRLEHFANYGSLIGLITTTTTIHLFIRDKITGSWADLVVSINPTASYSLIGFPPKVTHFLYSF